jgi:hypothetical protein
MLETSKSVRITRQTERNNLHLWEVRIKLSLYLIKYDDPKEPRSVVGIATAYGLDNRGIEIRVRIRSRIFISPCHPDRFWDPTNILANGHRVLFLRGNAAGTWSWPLTSNCCWGPENMDLYIHSPIRLLGVVLNYLSAGATLPFLHDMNTYGGLEVYLSAFLTSSLEWHERWVSRPSCLPTATHWI